MALAAAMFGAAGLVSLGCGRAQRPQGAPGLISPADIVVARVGDVAITAADVAAQMAARPGLDRRAALEERILFESLALEAATHDLPPLTAAERSTLIEAEAQRIVAHDIEPRLTRASISDGDVRSLYERGKHRFVHGRLVQAAVAYVFTGARLKPEPRQRAERSAQALRDALARNPPHSAAALEAFVKEAAWTERGVGSTVVWQDVDANEPFPLVVGRALAALAAPTLGTLTPLVGDETGYYVAMYLTEAAAENHAFDEVAEGLRAEMYEPWRRQRFLQLAMELTAGHDVEVYPDNLFPAARGQ